MQPGTLIEEKSEQRTYGEETNKYVTSKICDVSEKGMTNALQNLPMATDREKQAAAYQPAASLPAALACSLSHSAADCPTELCSPSPPASGWNSQPAHHLAPLSHRSQNSPVFTEQFHALGLGGKYAERNKARVDSSASRLAPVC